MRENIYIRKENEAKWSQLPNKSGWVNSMLEKNLENEAVRTALGALEAFTVTANDKDGEFEAVAVRDIRNMVPAALPPQTKLRQAEATDASGFGALEPCHGHTMRWDCGRPGCKYGAGK